MNRDMMIWRGSDEVRGMALTGARICIEHWMAENDTDMIAEAVARYRRIMNGTALVCDIEGAIDWLDQSTPQA